MERKKQGVGSCVELEKKLSAFIENIALNQSLSLDQEFLLDMVSSPGQEAGYYLDKIFSSEKTNKHALSLFFRLFPAQTDDFNKRLGQKFQEIEFLAGLIDALGGISGDGALAILEHIYSSANELIKAEVLKAMRKLKKVDVNFLMRQLNTASFPLRKSLFSILVSVKQVKESAMGILFNIPSFLGQKNNLIIENIQIVSDLRFVEAAGWIRNLSRRKRSEERRVGKECRL